MSDVSFAGAARSELWKLWTLRSAVAAYVAIASALVVVAGVIIVSPASDTRGSSGDELLVLLVVVEMLVGVTGVLASTTEYSAHTIRSTFAAVPRRLPVLAAKVLVHAGSVLALLAPAMLAGLLAATAFAPDDVGSLTDTSIVRGLAGCALVFTATSASGVSLGILTRSTPAAIGLLFALFFLPVMVTVAPALTAYAPGRLAQAIVLSDNPAEAYLLNGTLASVVLLAWAATTVGAAAMALRRRDA